MTANAPSPDLLDDSYQRLIPLGHRVAFDTLTDDFIDLPTGNVITHFDSSPIPIDVVAFDVLP